MKKYFIFIIIIIILNIIDAEGKKIIFMGNSRAVGLSTAEKNYNVVKNAMIDGQRIVADGEIDETNDPYFYNCGDVESDFWFPFILDYNYDITLISLGGNDVIHSYKYLEKIQSWIFIRRAILNPFLWLRFHIRERPMTWFDELFWLWHMQSVTDDASCNVLSTSNRILLLNSNNKVMVNDVAPTFQGKVMKFEDFSNFDWQEFFRVNMYLTILNKKFLNFIMGNPFLIANRLNFLYTSPVFFDHLLQYYTYDGVHFNLGGYEAWGRLFAQRCVSLGWLEGYGLPNITNPADVIIPDFGPLPSGSWSNELPIPWLVPVAPIERTFHIYDDNNIFYVYPVEKVGGVTTGGPPPRVYIQNCKIRINPDSVEEGTHEFIVTVYDGNLNEMSFRFTYTKTITAIWPALGWWWYNMTITWNSELL